MKTRKPAAPTAAPTAATTAAPSIRARGQWRAIAGVVLGTLFTLTAAAAQLMPGRARPEARRPIDDELAAIVVERRDRIAELWATAPSGRCHPASAHELARLLVMDGQWPAAQRFADDYEQRCGDDPIIRKWGDAPRPHRRP